MSRKHFIKLAANLRSQIDDIRGLEVSKEIKQAKVETWLAAVNNVVQVCAEANPSFDRARFQYACGIAILPTITL